MLKSYGRKKRMKKLMTIIFLVSAIFYLAFAAFNSISNSGVTVAKVGSDRIYKADIKNKFFQIFNNSVNQDSFDINNIPKEILRSLSKEVYVEKQLVKKAKKSRIQNDEDVKRRIESSRDQIILDSFIDKLIFENTTEKKVSQKYLDLTMKVKGKKEYEVAKIIFSDQKKANSAFTRLNKSKPKYLDYRFKSYSKESLKNKDIEYIDSDYVIENYIDEDVLAGFDKGKKLLMKKIDKKFVIFKNSNSRLAIVPKLDEEYKKEIKALLTQEVMMKLVESVIKNKEVVILDEYR